MSLDEHPNGLPKKHRWSWRIPEGSFSTDGCHFVHIGRIGPIAKNYMCVLKMQQDQTRLLWRRHIEGNYRGPTDNFVGANSRFLFMIDSKRITVLDIGDGALVKTVPFWEPNDPGAVPRWSFTNYTEVCKRIIVTENVFMVIPVTYPYSKSKAEEIIMLNLDRFEFKHQSIEAYGSPYPDLKTFHDASMALIMPSFDKENVKMLCHMNLTEADCDQVFAKRSMMSSKVVDEIFKKGSIQSRRFREINLGTYMLEIGSKRSGFDGKKETFVEVISWRSEELSRAMSKFLQLAGFNKIESDTTY